jgi:hypothetical protein
MGGFNCQNEDQIGDPMPKLNQILAVEKQTKTNTAEQVTAFYHLLQKEPLLNGISRTYRPLDEEGEKFPSESTEVQVRVEQTLKDVAKHMTALFDITIARDAANTLAKSDVVVNGVVLLKDVPATYLLWLEKQLTELHTYIVKLPVLPQTDSWTYDGATGTFKTDAIETSKTKKLPRAFVKYEATKEHPAQVDTLQEDKLVGYWSTTKFSGAVKRDRAQALRDRVETLMAAVKQAREQANLVEVPKVAAGQAVFDYLLAP